MFIFASVLADPTVGASAAHVRRIVTEKLSEEVARDEVVDVRGLLGDAALPAYQQNQVDSVIHQTQSLREHLVRDAGVVFRIGEADRVNHNKPVIKRHCRLVCAALSVFVGVEWVVSDEMDGRVMIDDAIAHRRLATACFANQEDDSFVGQDVPDLNLGHFDQGRVDELALEFGFANVA